MTTTIALGNNAEVHAALVAPNAVFTLLANNVSFEGSLDVGGLTVSNNNDISVIGPGLGGLGAGLCD